jgi:hypothetical protein
MFFLSIDLIYKNRYNLTIKLHFIGVIKGMSKFLLTIFLFVLFRISLFCQYNPGARQIALANSDVGQADDVFSVFSNPGGLSQIRWREAGIYYSPAPFGFKELANGFLAYLEPFPIGSAAIGIMTYGFELYREFRITAGFSYSYRGKIFAGFSAGYYNVSIKNYGSAGTFSADIGGLIYINDFIRWGFSFQNVNHSTFAGYDDQIPVILNTGISTDITRSFTFNAALEKDIRYNASFRFGFEYDLIQYLSIRTGFSNEPSRFTAGIGMKYSIVNLDYAVFTHNDLGLTHQAGLILKFSSGRSDKIKSEDIPE